MIPTRTEISIETPDPRQEYNNFIRMVIRTHPQGIIAHIYDETLEELLEIPLSPPVMNYLGTLVRYYRAHWKRYASDSPGKWDGWEAERRAHWYDALDMCHQQVPKITEYSIQRWIDIYADMTYDPNAAAMSPIRRG